MATIKQVFASEASVTTTDLSTLADDGVATSNEIDNTTNLYLGAELEVKLTGTATTSTGFVDVYMKRSNSSAGDYSTDSTEENYANMLKVTSVALNTNTAVVKIVRVNELPPYWKLHFVNLSGGALTAEAVVFRGTNLSNA